MRDRIVLARSLGVFELVVAFGALAGGAALACAPDGTLLKMPLELLDGTPFRTYLIPGLVLLLVVGGSNLLAGLLALSRHRFAPWAAMVAGAILTGWIAMEMALLGYLHPIQLVYLLAGVGIIGAGAALTKSVYSVSDSE